MTSARYRVTRLELARIAAEEYVRSFWWFLIITPLFGVIALFTATGLLQIIGWMAMLWPFSIPARAILSSSKAGRLFVKGTWVELDENVLYFHSDDGKGMRLPLRSLRDAVIRGEFLVLRLRRYAVVPIPIKAMTQEDLQRLLAAIGDSRPGISAM